MSRGFVWKEFFVAETMTGKYFLLREESLDTYKLTCGAMAQHFAYIIARANYFNVVS
jgi:hypothetical protein